MSKAESFEAIKVVVRVRPFNEDEKSMKCKQCVDVDSRRSEIMIKHPQKENLKVFTFDSVYDMSSKQSDIYNETARPIVDSVMEGYNGTIFAYGQTGSGKTWTMEGRDDPELLGVIPNSFRHIFEKIESTSKEKRFLVRASMFEIYNEEVRDLIGRDPKQKLEVKEDSRHGFYVKDLTSTAVSSIKEINQVLKIGHRYRSVGVTNMNERSSRSHLLFVITIESICFNSVDGKEHIRSGKLNLVDLAGSERQSKTGATGERLKEGVNINLSLMILGTVIQNLVAKATYVPFRESRLTKLLMDSLGGNTKTVMIANCSPADYNYDETLGTLRYASTAKQIQNKPRINEDPKDTMIRKYQEEIEKLKQMLSQKDRSSPNMDGSVAVPNIAEDKLIEMIKKNEDEKRQLVLQMKEKSEVEKQDMMKAMARLEHESKKMQDEMHRRHEEELQRKKQEFEKEREDMQKKLKEMESKVMTGGENTKLIEKQKEETVKLQQKLKEQESVLQLKMKEKEKELNVFKAHFNSTKEELEAKNQLIKKLLDEKKNLEQDNEDLRNEFAREKLILQENIHQMKIENRIQQMIVDRFIPPEEEAKIRSVAKWDEESEDWIIDESLVKENRNKIYTQLMEAQSQNMAHNSRYRYENVAGLSVEIPERTTEDYPFTEDNPYDRGGPVYSEFSPSTASSMYSSRNFETGSSNSSSAEGSKKRPKTARRSAISTELPIEKAVALRESSANSATNYPSARRSLQSAKPKSHFA